MLWDVFRVQRFAFCKIRLGNDYLSFLRKTKDKKTAGIKGDPVQNEEGKGWQFFNLD